jgi:hypothetical protein
MNASLKSARRQWGWPSLQLACFAVILLAAGCSQATAPTYPAALSTSAGAAHVHSSDAGEPPANVNAMLAVVRAATAKYHNISAAQSAGYELGYKGLVTGCVANPGVGAMGYHYFNWAKMDDPSIIQDDPEVLVYHVGNDGTLVLGAVEWVVRKTLWDATGNIAPPVVFGHTLHILNPGLNWYVEHAWVWTENPSGMFADWNPHVACP